MSGDRGGDEEEKREEEEKDAPSDASVLLQHPPTASFWLQALLVGLAQVAQGQVLATWISN